MRMQRKGSEMSDDFINREMLAERDAAVKMLDAALARISALEAALAKADALAEQCDDAFYHLDGVGLPEFYHTLTAYRQARDATT